MAKPLFGNFRRPARFMPAPDSPGSSIGNPQLIPGEIEFLDRTVPGKYRATIRLTTGSRFTNVRLPGPAYEPGTGLLHGFKFGFFEGQRVLVGFPYNKPNNPEVIAAYPHPAGDRSETGLSSSTGTDLPGDTEIGHYSGYKITFTDDAIIVWVEGQKVPAITFKPSTKSLTLNAINVTLTGGGTVTTDGPVSINNTLTVFADLTVTAGDVVMAAATLAVDGILNVVNATIGGIDFLQHRHSYTDDGVPANTGVPS